MVPRQVVEEAPRVEVARLQVGASPPWAMARPLQSGPGADVHVAHPTLLRGQMPPEVRQYYPNAGVATKRHTEALLGGGGGFGAAFGTAFTTATTGAVGRTVGTLGGGGGCIIPSTG